MRRESPDAVQTVSSVVRRNAPELAFHFERSITLDGRVLGEEQATAVSNARTLAKEIEDNRLVPKSASSVVAALQKHVLASSVVAAMR